MPPTLITKRVVFFSGRAARAGASDERSGRRAGVVEEAIVVSFRQTARASERVVSIEPGGIGSHFGPFRTGELDPAAPPGRNASRAPLFSSSSP